MDGHALDVLELPAILDRLAARTATPVGEELAWALAPSPDAAEVAGRQALTAEAIGLLDEAAEPDLHGVADVRDAVAQAARGALLAPAALREVARTASAGVAARAAVETPLLAEVLAPVEPSLASLAEAVGR